MKHLVRLTLFLLVVLAGCFGSSTSPSGDAGVGGLPEGGTAGGFDAATDRGIDAGHEAGTDAMPPAAFAVTPGAHDFGSVLQGTPTSAVTFTVENTGGVASGIPAVAVGGASAADFTVSADQCTAALAAGAKCTFGVAFDPSMAAAESATVTVTGAGTTSGTATLTGTGTALAPVTLTISPAMWPFGTWASSGPSTSQLFTVTNVGGVASGMLTAALGGANSGDFATGSDMCTGQTLAPNATCTISAWFDPQGMPLGPLAATLTVGDGTASASAALTATSVQPAALTITAQAGFTGFGPVLLNTSASSTFTVANGGGVASGTITMSLSGSGEYALMNDTCTGTTLAPMASCTVGVQFTPTTTGAAPGQLDLAAAPGGPATYALTGTGETPAALSMQPPSGFTGFGNVPLGSTATYQFTLTNSGTQSAGTPSISTNSTFFTVSSPGNCNAPIATTCTFSVTFAPGTAGPPATDSVTISATSTPGGTATYGPTTGTGTGAVLSLGPATWDTSFTACGTHTQDFTITNTGNVPTTTAIAVTLSGAQSQAFSIGAYTCTGLLQPNTPCTIPVSFGCPTGATFGYEGIGTLTITAGGTPAAATATLDVGAGVALDPDPAAFGGAITPGTTATQVFTVKNFTGAVTKSVVGFLMAGTDPGDYTATDISCVGNTLAVGGSCSFSVKYSAPVGAAGTDPATVEVECPASICTLPCPCYLTTGALSGSEN